MRVQSVPVGWATSDWADPFGVPSLGGAGWARCGWPRELTAPDAPLGTLAWIETVERFAVRSWDGTFTVPDVLIAQRWMHGDVTVKVRRARRAGQRIVNDVDDLFWSLDRRNRAWRTTDPAHNPDENRVHYLATLRASSLVTVSTPFLAERLRRLLGESTPIRVVRNGVDPGRYFPRPVRQSRRVAVGWVGATQWRSGDLETLRGVLGPFLAEHFCTFHHGGDVEGAPLAAVLAGVPGGVPVSTAPMASIVDYPQLFAPLDVGLVPLNDVPFNHAKSAIKGLEYAAAGVPFVASALPEYVLLAERWGIGRVARRPRDWTRHLRALLDPEVRAEDQARNFAGLVAFGPDVVRDAWAETLGVGPVTDGRPPVPSV